MTEKKEEKDTINKVQNDEIVRLNNTIAKLRNRLSIIKAQADEAFV